MKRYIAIDLLALKQHKLSLEEWTLLENIYFMSNNELGYCYASKETLRDIIQVSNGQIYKIITNLIENGFLIKNKQTGFIKVTQKWLEISSGDTLQKMENESPKNGIDTLQKMETKIDNIKRDIKKEKKYIKKEIPTLEEIENYIQEKKYFSVDAKMFFDYYSCNNWEDVKNWKQKLITWNSKSKPKYATNGYTQTKSKSQQRNEQIDKFFAEMNQEKDTSFDFDGEIIE